MKIQATKRERTGTNDARQLRKQGKLPATLYARGEPLSLVVEREVLEPLLTSGRHAVELEIEGESTQLALIKACQWDTFGLEPLHADFKRVELDDVVSIHQALVIKGVPRGQMAGGTVETYMISMPVTCKMRDIPSEAMVVNIEPLEVGDSLCVQDIALPPGVVATADPHAPIVSVMLSRRKMAMMQEVADAELAAEAEAGAGPAPAAGAGG